MKPKKFYMHRISNLVNVQNIVTIHYQKLTQGYVSPEEEHNFWELIYADRGRITIVEEGRELTLSEGEAYLIRPALPHFVRAPKGEPYIFIVSFGCRSESMRFFGDSVLPLPEKYRYLLQNIMTEAENTFRIPDFDPALVRLETREHPLLGGEQAIKNCLELLLIHLLRNANESVTERAFFHSKIASSGELQDEIVRFLHAKLYDTFTLDELAAHLHYGKTKLCTVFREKTGMSIYQTYLKLKTDEAKKLIRRGAPLTEIANGLCFDSLSHFNNVFRRYAGLTPMQYKKSLR